MNLQIRNLLKGIGSGLILSILLTLLLAAFASSVVGDLGIQGWLSLLQSSAVPIILCSGISAYNLGFKDSSRLKFWLICAIMGFLSVLYIATIGALIPNVLMFGIDNINVIGYFQWGPIYALGFLPLSTLIVAAIHSNFQDLSNDKSC